MFESQTCGKHPSSSCPLGRLIDVGTVSLSIEWHDSKKLGLNWFRQRLLESLQFLYQIDQISLWVQAIDSYKKANAWPCTRSCLLQGRPQDVQRTSCVGPCTKGWSGGWSHVHRERQIIVESLHLCKKVMSWFCFLSCLLFGVCDCGRGRGFGCSWACG